MRFIETPIFTGRITAAISDEQYQRLQVALMLRPMIGDLVRGTGGLRKVRWTMPGRGKRGGLRIIYYWSPAERVFYMLYVYAKNEQGDLSSAQIRVLRRLVQEELR